MRCNLAMWDRVIRFIFGIILFVWAIAGGPFWAYFGFYLIITSSWGFDPAYAFLKIRTLRFSQSQSPNQNNDF